MDLSANPLGDDGAGALAGALSAGHCPVRRAACACPLVRARVCGYVCVRPCVYVFVCAHLTVCRGARARVCNMLCRQGACGVSRVRTR